MKQKTSEENVCLKQPFKIPSIDLIENIFDDYAQGLKEISVPLLQLDCFPSNIFGYESGVLSIRAEKTPQLEKMQKDLFRTR